MNEINQEMKWDVFISHASEDKSEVALPLAQMLRQHGLRVWPDEHELVLGDSLRRKIDEGSAQSSWGVIVLNPFFFDKEWPQAELDALVSRELNGKRVILPVWHRISAPELLKKSPLLASRIGIDTKRGLDAVCEAVIRAINRERKTGGLPESLEPEPGAESIHDYWFKLPWPELHRKLHSKPESFIGHEVGQYALNEFVGMGGTGAVFKATHIPLGKPAAFKLFYPLKGQWDSITRATERAVRGKARTQRPD